LFDVLALTPHICLAIPHRAVSTVSMHAVYAGFKLKNSNKE